MASLRVGGDLAYVICCESASSTIKSYSPELIVSPILDDDSFKNEFSLLVPKLHSIIIGFGLGRKREQFQEATEVIKLAKQHDLPITIDADAVLLVADSPELIKGYQKTILTPNAREFDYLCDKIGIGGCNLKIIDQDEIRSKVNKLSNYQASDLFFILFNLMLPKLNGTFVIDNHKYIIELIKAIFTPNLSSFD